MKRITEISFLSCIICLVVALLAGCGGKKPARAASSQQIVGVSWQVDSINGIEHMRLNVSNTRLSLDLSPDSTFMGSTGCNSFVGRYGLQEVGAYSSATSSIEGTALAFDVQQTGQNFCLTLFIEQSYIEQLEATVCYYVENDTLKMFNSEDECTLMLTKNRY